MNKNELLSKAWGFTKGKIKETAIEIGKGATDKIKENAIKASHEIADNLKDKATGYIENKLSSDKKETEKKNIEQIQDKKEILVETSIVVTDNMTKEEEDKYVDNLTSKLLDVGLSAINNPKEALEVVTTLVYAASEVRKFQELQITKRVEIDSVRQQALAKIDLQKALLMGYLEKTFDERKDIFKQQFKVVDDALAKGNIQQLALGLDSINKLATSSPFKDLASIENIGSALDNPNTVWEF